MSTIPYGDPAGMRAEAASARVRAEQIAAIAQSLETQVESTEYEGPAADAFRPAMLDRTNRANQAASTLEDVAGVLNTSAAQVEQEQALANTDPGQTPDWG